MGSVPPADDLDRGEDRLLARLTTQRAGMVRHGVRCVGPYLLRPKGEEVVLKESGCRPRLFVRDPKGGKKMREGLVSALLILSPLTGPLVAQGIPDNARRVAYGKGVRPCVFLC
jgi:hypothetical protein